mmetsp:Transcript_8547/g.21888  ORF Transcript_8547/g.21888 Transcript_8547/m.21888 type:complete len:266 (+) Transcript_8547:205-1002(+)
MQDVDSKLGAPVGEVRGLPLLLHGPRGADPARERVLPPAPPVARATGEELHVFLRPRGVFPVRAQDPGDGGPQQGQPRRAPARGLPGEPLLDAGLRDLLAVSQHGDDSHREEGAPLAPHWLDRLAQRHGIYRQEQPRQGDSLDELHRGPPARARHLRLRLPRGHPVQGRQAAAIQEGGHAPRHAVQSSHRARRHQRRAQHLGQARLDHQVQRGAHRDEVPAAHRDRPLDGGHPAAAHRRTSRTLCATLAPRIATAQDRVKEKLVT